MWEDGGKFYPKPLGKEHFRHLGKDLQADLSGDRAKAKALNLLKRYVVLVDGTLLRCIDKLWI